jgi:2-keto-4-pentenoate hydratase/2-oxohepta-3-ene-1,7-dioic acid hydratase in catechol pathway
MKFVRIKNGEQVAVGVVDGDLVVELYSALSAKRALSSTETAMLVDMTPLIAAGPAGRALAEEGLQTSRSSGKGRRKLSDVRLAAPLHPGLILASGGNYSDHRNEKDEAPLAGKEPEFFFKTPNSVIGPDETIERDPRVTSKLDYEVELAVVIGKKGRHIREEQVADYIFGYCILNDVTARERQVRWRPDGTYFYEAGSSKNFDTSTPLGPFIATADEVPDPQNLALRTYVNDELRQNNSTRNMTFSAAHLVSFFSTFLTLYPGYVIATGTPGGTAWGNDSELGGKPYLRDDVVRGGYLNVGDVVRCEVEKLGVLRNVVVGPQHP